MFSAKQLALLTRLSLKYKGEFNAEDFGVISGILNIPQQEAVSPVSAGTDLTALFAKFESVKEWAEPRKIGRMIYDDKAFYESLLKQHKAGKDLSAKQLAALQKLAGKYSLV